MQLIYLTVGFRCDNPFAFARMTFADCDPDCHYPTCPYPSLLGELPSHLTFTVMPPLPTHWTAVTNPPPPYSTTLVVGCCIYPRLLQVLVPYHVDSTPTLPSYDLHG